MFPKPFLLIRLLVAVVVAMEPDYAAHPETAFFTV